METSPFLHAETDLSPSRLSGHHVFISSFPLMPRHWATCVANPSTLALR